MAWFKLNDEMPEHPKFVRAGVEAGWLYVCGLAYASRLLTDGFIPEGVVSRLSAVRNARREAEALVAAGLWERAADGFQIHDYLEHQESAERVRGRRQRDRARKDSARNPDGIQAESQKGPEGFRVLDVDVDTEESSDELSPEVSRLCDLLADLIAANGSKRPTAGKRWHEACRLMLDRDERSPEEVERIIRWSQQDQFWSAVILSMPKLREKFDQLRLKAGPRLAAVPAECPGAAQDDRLDSLRAQLGTEGEIWLAGAHVHPDGALAVPSTCAAWVRKRMGDQVRAVFEDGRVVSCDRDRKVA
jgi:hypothetical protein